jgi:deoxycytidylate deaminase
MSSHIEMMNLAERVAKNSDCSECKVGAVIALADGGVISSSNTAAWDCTNDNHAESKLIVMAGLARYSLAASTLYVTRRPCVRCTAMLLPLELKAIYYRDEQPEMGHLQQLRDAGVLVDSGWIQGQIQQSWAERNGVAG